MTNGTVELLVLADVGSRILHYGFAGKRNEFQEFAGDAGERETTRQGQCMWQRSA